MIQTHYRYIDYCARCDRHHSYKISCEDANKKEDKPMSVTLTYKQIQEMIDNNQNPSAEVVWNSAIEAAAKIASNNGEGCTQDIDDMIRKLKQ